MQAQRRHVNQPRIQLLRLYERNDPEGPTVDDVTADVVHHFLLAICTRPGTGICFQDCGWYPRENAEVDEVSPEMAGPSKSSSRIYNKILANILRSLKVNEDARQQELAYRILKACPELIAGYVYLTVARDYANCANFL